MEVSPTDWVSTGLQWLISPFNLPIQNNSGEMNSHRFQMFEYKPANMPHVPIYFFLYKVLVSFTAVKLVFVLVIIIAGVCSVLFFPFVQCNIG